MSKQQQYRFSRQTHHFGRDDSISIWERIHIDPWLMLLLLTISFIGLAILYSASTQDVDMVIRQAVSYLLGFTVMITMAQIPPGLYKTFTPIFYVIGLFSLVLVEIIGEVRMGAQRWWMIGSAVGMMIPTVWVGWTFLMHDYQKQRVLTLFNPEADLLGAGWNITQSKTAIGAGGLTGKGYLEGTQSHLHFLPEGHTDFIIAAFSEEFGLLGVSVLIFIYSCILIRSFYIAAVHVDTFGRLLAGAIAMSFFVYVFVNIGMVGGILPVVGVPLPLVSYGGTAIITLMAGFGLLMSVYTHNVK